MTELKRRTSDTEIAQLIARVEQLDIDVKSLRDDFDDHTQSEATKIELLNASLLSIQVKLDQLLIDIKEPVEAYRTAKYGMGFFKYVAETGKWLVPIIVGLVIAYAPMSDKQKDQFKETVQQLQKEQAAQGEKK